MPFKSLLDKQQTTLVACYLNMVFVKELRIYQMLRGYMDGYNEFAYIGMLLEHDIHFKKTKNISNVERVYGWV